MPIRSIEVICIPCPKCKMLEQLLKQMVENIGRLNKVTISFEFKHTKTLQDLARLNVNAAQTPAILVNGNVEFAGKYEPDALRKKLEGIHKTG
jgi:glutaredoxin